MNGRMPTIVIVMLTVLATLFVLALRENPREITGMGLVLVVVLVGAAIVWVPIYYSARTCARWVSGHTTRRQQQIAGDVFTGVFMVAFFGGALVLALMH